jgi:FkbM family methyltransferase
MEKARTENGTLYYYESNDPIVNGLKNGLLFADKNFDLLQHYSDKLNKSGCILDIGAHIGSFASKALSDESIEINLVEADKKNFECLQKTFGNNKNVSLYNDIIYSKNRKIDFVENKGPFGWIVENESGKFDTTTLDFLFAKKKIKSIKIDIEGSEILALDGAKEILKQKPVMLIEVNGYCLMQRDKTSNDLLIKLKELGYNCFFPNKSNLLKINPESFFPFCVCDVLCVHKSESFKLNFSYLEEESCKEIYKNIKNSFNENCQSYFNYLKNKNADLHI